MATGKRPRLWVVAFFCLLVLLLFAINVQVSVYLASVEEIYLRPIDDGHMKEVEIGGENTTSSHDIKKSLLLPDKDNGRMRAMPTRRAPQSGALLGGSVTKQLPISSLQSHASNTFERHYSSVYRSMILQKEIPPKFILFQLNPMAGLGFGNRIRSLNGAMFLAAIADRVLLVEEFSPFAKSFWGMTFSSMFRPPVVDGIELDWNVTLANGVCDSSKDTSANIPKNTDAILKDFLLTYGNVSCIIVGASHGHDRQVASQNEVEYKDTVVRLFGSTSRFNWSRYTLGLILQRPNPSMLSAATSALDRIDLLAGVPNANRIAIQFRTFYDLAKPGGKKEQDEKWRMEKSAKIFWDCAVRLVKERFAELQVLAPAKPSNVTVLFTSDSAEMRIMAKDRLGSISGCSVVDLDLPVVHTGRKRAGEKSTGFTNAFLEWFMIGECGTVIATGASSFAITAFFRPSLLPSVDINSKKLYTVENGIVQEGNLQCGEIQPNGYGDLNFGFSDA